MRVYSSTTANEAWKLVATDLLRSGQADRVSSRLGSTLEFVHAALEITDPRQRWVLARTPAMNPAFALAEVVWLVTGRDDTAFISHWFPSYPQYVGCGTHQDGAYGKRLRRRYGFDQIKRAYRALRRNPTSRQVTLQIWHPSDDLPDERGRPRSPDVPCNLQSLLKIRGGRLEWLQVVRSNDIDRGLPHNFVQFTMLQELMAGWLGVDVGSYVHVMDSIHWYSEQSQRMGIDENVIPSMNQDRFEQSYKSSMESFDLIAALMDDIVKARSQNTSPAYEESASLSGPYENIFMIIAADDARRYGEQQAADSLVQRCDNPVLRQLWSRWVDRTSQTNVSTNVGAA